MAQLAARVVLTRDDFIVRNHRVHGVAVLPGVAFLDIVFRMLAAAGEDVTRAVLRDVVFTEAVAAAEGRDREIVCEIDADVDGMRAVRARSRWLEDGAESSPWSQNITARLVFRDEPTPTDLDIKALREDAVRVGDMSELYARARREDIDHGAPMRCSGPLYFGESSLLAHLMLEEPGDGQEEQFHLHPAKLDASTLAGFALTEVSGQHPFIPMFIQEFRAPRSIAGPCYLYVPRPETLAPSGDVITSDYALYDAEGRYLAGFQGLTCKRIRHPELITRLLPVLPQAEPAADSPADAERLAEHLRTLIADRLGRALEDIRTDVGFYELGLDSLALMDLGRELESAVGQALYPTLLFEYSDITSLAAHLVATYDVTLPQVTAAVDEALAEAEPAVTEFRAPRWVFVPAGPADVAATVVMGPEPVDSELLGDDIALEIPTDTDVETATRTFWRLAVSVAARTSTGPIRLTAVCRTTDLDAPIPAALAALARTITAETPQIRCRVVAGPQNPDIRSLLQMAGDDPAEAEIRIVDGRRHVRRWDLVSAADGNRQQVLRNGGAYLITGGAGGIARLLTSHLVERYGAHVMLAGRRPEPAVLGPLLRDWNQGGGDVRYVEADVSGADGAQRAIDAVREAFGVLDGVIHCAGVRRDRLYFRKEADDFAAVFGPKAHGTSALDAALGDSELDFFAVFSSVSATVANPGQADYAAANACAEAVVQRRASRPDRRGRSVAIAWPYWASGAMTVADDVIRRAVAEKGTAPLPTAQALAAFDDALAAGEPRLVVLHGDGRRIRGLLPMPETAPEPVSAPDTADAPGGIAIIGMAGRFPQAPDVDAFWRNLAAGRDSITEIPSDRWDADTDHDTAGWGGFLDGVDRFDPVFFGISRREAELMDPQERLFLTTSWHAVEDAGYAPDALRGRPVGVFAGVMWNHYQLLIDPGTGVAPTAMHSAIANRVSYTLDLTGPSLAVDTACSSSLYALHLAVQSLLLGECELALAGGVNASVHPQKYRQLAHGHWLSEDGRCRSFGTGGSGYVPGEGVGCVVLKPLAAALRDGDQVHGVIRASAVNHGGRTGGVTVPSPVAQASVVAEAVRRAGWAPETIGYVEAHGTGTSLGDPIEVEGLRRALDGDRAAGRKVALGSVKSNIGHLEGAAGIAGVIKVLRQMRHGSIAPSLHSGELNPRIDFAATPFVVPQQLTPWPRWDGRPRRAGVSAFGAGGANCHVLIEEAPVVSQHTGSTGSGPWLFVLSARTRDALRDQASALAMHVNAARSAGGLLERVAGLLGVSPDAVDPRATLRDLALGPADLRLLVDDADIGLDDTVEDLLKDSGDTDHNLDHDLDHDHHPDLAAIATTLQVGRNAMKHRLAVVAADAAELAEALNRYVGGDESAAGVVDSNPGDADAPTDLVEAFTQGELWTVAEFWLRGADVPWQECLASIGVPVRRVGLPGYPFQEESVWIGQWQSGTRSRTRSGPSPAAGGLGDGSERRAAAVLEPTPAVDTTGPEAELRILDDGLALITMRSPMFTAGLLAGLQDALARAEADESVRAVVITGAGGVFSMGGTPEALASLAAGQGRFSDVPFLYEGLLRCTLPVVAALQGHASGGGLAFGLFADVAVLAEEADYRANFVAYGFTPGVGATFILEHRLGAAVATELMLTGRALRGSDLARRGAGVTVVPAARVLATALDLARSMADKPTAAVRALKAELASRMLDRLPAVVEREVAMHEEVLGPEAAAVVQARFARTGQAKAVQLPEKSGAGERTISANANLRAADEPGPDNRPMPTKVELRTADEVGAGNRPTRSRVELLATGESGAIPANVEPRAVDQPGAGGRAVLVTAELRASGESVAGVESQAAGEPRLGLAEVLAIVEEVVGDVLYLGPDELDRALSFAEMGLDSVGAVELIGRLNQRFGTDLDSVAVYDHPTSPALAEAVRAALARSQTSVAAALIPAPAVAEPEPAIHPEPVPEAPRPARTGQIQLVQIDDVPAAPGTAATVEPIAVIGMSGRFPDAPDLETFWANLAAGRSSIREVPASRWDVQAHYDPDRRVPDRTYSKWAALLADPGAFDAPFFQLSPLDAEAMDPQQRLFLQESWHALEDAGYAADPGGVRRPWGVFVGCGAGDYADLLDQAGLGGTGQAFLGGDPSMLPARVAYLLNLSGPTVALDTACSSSLVAVDLACAALVRGECEMVLAGGVAVMTTPKMHVWCSKTGMLSPTGRSAPFDATADGIVLGEAVGVVVLKPLSRALADGDHIHGVIRASGVNGDGRTNGITAPSATAQAELIARVHARAGIGADDVGYVEAHGTGTELGDPIEVKALTEVFRRTTDRTGYCGLGSVKGNIGHTTLAAGIAGLLKVLLALRRKQLPPSPGYTTPNPHLDLGSGPFYVVRELAPWQAEAGRDRVATVSSFGFSGTNCHVVVSEPPAGARREPGREDAEPVLVTLSARTDAALARQVAALAGRLDPATPLADVAYTLAVGRRPLARRAAFVASDHQELRTLLKAFDAGSGAQPDADTKDTPTRTALRRLGADFVAGLEVNLADAMAGPGRRRVSLPTYPFDTKDYWPPVPAPRTMTIAATDPVVADHRVGGVPVLPAAAGIVIALEASGAQPTCLRSLRFLRPVQVVDQVQVRLETAGESFRLEDEQGAYLSGTFATADTQPGALDLATLTDLCERTESAQARYAEFARAGIEYRGDHKIIETLRYGAQDALATLRAVGSVRRPAVLDGAIQAAAPLVTAGEGVLLPFAVDRITVFAPDAVAHYSHVRREAENRFTVSIADESGRICARLEGVALRSAPVVAASRTVDSMIFVPEWSEAQPGLPAPASRVAILANPGDPLAHALALHGGASATIVPFDQADTLWSDPDHTFDTVHLLAPTEPADPVAVTTATFRVVRGMIDAGLGRRELTITLVVRGTDSAGLIGLASALAAEQPRWRIRSIDICGDSAAADADLITSADGALTVIRDGRPLRRRLVSAEAASPAPSPVFRTNGVYAIVGGAGGIGLTLSRHLARTVGARIAWIGRRPEDAAIRAASADVESLGGAVRYFSADVADAPALRAALDRTRAEFGPLNGVIHAALQLADRTLSTMTERDLATVLSPKMIGTVALADAVGDDKLDFLAFFSTALSFAPAPGQGNYAAASTFQDAYALQLRDEGVPAVVVNWGFWGSVGAVAGPEYRTRFTALGIEPIEAEEGIAAFEHVLASGLPQALVVKGTPEGLARLGVVTGAATGDAIAPELAAAMHGYATLDRVARRLLTGRPAVSAALDHAVADRAGLAEAVRDLLRRAADDDPAADPEQDLVSDHPELAAHLTLLRRCADAVPEVLTGRKSGVEVLLPRGSADDVEAVYRGNPGSDFHHRLLADQVAERAARIAAEQGRPARILEIGAGTGAGTAFVLRACDDNGSAPFIDFTDVSQAFLSRAEHEFGQNHPRMAFRILDIEKDPIEQGFDPQSYDIVLAGNVLHATVDIAATSARTRTLLRPGGLLLVNEVTRTSDFLTLTFGLTPGWWRFSDPGKRLPNTPLLSARQWEQALAGAGFSVRQIGGIPGLPADRLEQVVVAAQSPAGAEPVTARAVRDYVKGVFAEVLKFDVADLDDTAQFDAFGIDSLVSLAIVDRFEADLGELPSTLLFEHQTIAVLADHLRDLRGDRLTAVWGTPQTSPVPVSVAVVEQPAVDPEPVVRTERSDDPGIADTADTADTADIAIIGVAGRYPGSPDLDTFWRNLAAGTDCVTEVPAERWDWREHFDPRRGRPQHTYGKWGGFIDGIDQFDAGFFGVLPRDAAAIDPQERLFLETAWSLLQDAGCLSASRGRQATGVFVGTMYGSYGRLAAASGWPRGRYTDGHSSYWSIANRVSYTLDLRGPSLAVDSACSSSLTAVHLAAESLRRGECETAIAGGVNLLLHPAHLVALSSMGMLSDDGGCKVFDERANGFAPGEGVGAVLLKPLAAALADGDDVWAVIKGSHLNAGGRTAGYTVPNPNAQAELVVTALRRSGIDPSTLSYVEAHGTGTALGDPIEIAGLTRALREAGAPERCAVGSVKANIGHLEGAAGIAGLTKVLLQMRHGQIAPCANLEQRNPKIDLDASPLYLPTEAVEWPGDSPRRAGVSSFGAGGANAHLVLEGFDSALVSEADSFNGGLFVLLSARSAEQLRAMAGSMADFVQEHPSIAVADIAFTSQVGRAEFAQRVAVPASDRDALVELLRSFAEGKVGGGVVVGSGRETDLYDDASGVAFVSSLIRARDVAKLARLWAQGAPVRWRQLWPSGARRRVALPGYPFQRRRYWLPAEDDVRTVMLTGPEAAEHRVGGKRWASGAAVLEALGGAGGGGRLSDVRWLAPLDVDADGDRLRIIVDGATVTASAGDRVVARAVTDADSDSADTPGVADLAATRARCSQQFDTAGFYAGLRAGGLEHGPGLRPVSELWVGAGEVLARLEAPEAGSGRRLNAVLIDGALQALAAVGDGRGGGWLPVGVDAVRSYVALPERCWAHGRELEGSQGRRRFDIAVLDDAGRVLLALDGLQVAAGATGDTEVSGGLGSVESDRTIADSEPISTREVQPEVESGQSAIRYLRPSWTSAPAPASNAAPPATVLLLGVGPVAEAVADHLDAAGSRCVAATGTSRADFDLVLADLGGPADAIVHVPSPDAPFEPLLWCAVALLAHPERGAVRIVTASDAAVPGTVALAAPLRTLALEHSGFAAATVDSATSARHLLDELARLDVSAPEAERVREVRYVGDERMVRELQEFAPPAADGLALCAGGVYLVTGGAGGLGRIVARYLSGRAPVTVVLAGRSDLDEATRAELAAIGAPGSRIVYERTDVSRADDVADLVSRVRRDHGPLRGLIHAAGVNRDALAVNKDPRDIAEVLGAKYDGAHHLDAATGREPLDFVVFFSSVAAQTGNLGQVDYAYANACLDEFAADRERRRLAGECSGRTVSIGWPLWEEGGMAAGGAARKLFVRRWGSAPLATGDGLAALERAVAAGESCVIVDSVLMNAASASPAPVRRPAELADVEALLRTLASGFLLVDERHVDVDADLMDAGFDSISLTELVGHVNDHYGVDVLPTVLFECVNLAGFARYLVEVEQIGEPETDPVSAPDPIPEPEPLPVPDPTPEPSPVPEPIAIVGMAAVLPGSEDLDAFWRHLVAGDDLITPVPDDRADLRADPRTRDLRGGFLADVRSFDAALFGISPREAALMDPQQRLFLQTVWRAVEDAGYPASALAGTDTGLFAGVAACDYDDLLRDHGVEIEAHTASGVANCVLANRVSHLLDLHGPSEAIDTACSSALVAVHRAVSAIRSGECSAALAGGVNVLLSPGLFVAFDKSGMLAADGRCKTFDAAADGYVRGEGVGVVYLKSLSQALADRDHIHALIRGSAVNHGGRAPSLTAPNPAAQARVVAAAHRGAGVDPLSVGYIEAHGTGTRLGDPIEIEGLKKAFADLGGEADEPWVALGSVKTNIGHLEAAAGIAGLLKTVLALEHDQLPPTLNLSEPNPLLRLAGTPFRLNDRLRDWSGAGRRAGVSSFGFGGTNAHVVLEAAPATDADPPDPRSEGHPIVLSAPSAQALTEYADRLATYLTDRPDTDLTRFAATLQSGRERLAHRVGFVAADVAQAVALLRIAASGADDERLQRGVVRPARRGSVADVSADALSPEAAVAAWVAGEPAPWPSTPQGVRRLAGVPGFPFARTVHWFTSHRLETSVTPTSPIPNEPNRPGTPSAPTRPERPKVRLAPARNRSAIAAPTPSAVSEPEPEPPRVSQTTDTRPGDSLGVVGEHLAAVLGSTREEVPGDVAFADLGLDSILRMDLVRRINAALGIELKADDLYEHDTAFALAAHVATGGAAKTSSGSEPAAPEPAALGSAAPQAAAPTAAAPAAAVLGSAAPEIAMPESAAPKIAALESAAPVAAAPQAAAPTAAAPAAAVLGSAAPQPAALATPASPASAPATEPLPVRLADRLTRLAAATIGRALDPGATFGDNAFTSFDMLRTIAVLERGFGTLPKTLLFDQPTVDAVAAELVERFGEAAVERFLGEDHAGEVLPGRSVGISAEVPLLGESVTVAVLKRSLAEHPDLAALVADLDSVHAKEGGLAGRDIAPYALIGAERLGYFNVSMRADLLFAWSYVGSEEYFPVLAAEFFAYARARGLRPNFLSLLPLESVAGEPIAATPFGAVQRLENLPEFSTRGGKMSRLRYMIGHFQKAGESRTQEYRSGADPDMDRQIARMMDRWAESKDMVNPYVAVVRDEIQAGRLAERHRMFLTYLDTDLANVIIVTRIPSEPGYLMDLEFYPKDGPLGGLEYAIVQIIEALRAEGHTVFSFGASFGVAIGSTDHASAEAEQALAELRTAGIFGEGNFQFKNKFRPVNVPIYLCQPIGADRTPVSEVILTIADPTLTAPSTTQSTAIATQTTATAAAIVTAPQSWPDLLAAHDWNPLAVPHDRVGEDFVTDSWAELDSDAIRARTAALAAASAHQDPEQRPAWLPFEHTVLTGSGRSAEALLCRAFPARRAAVLHNGLFPTWYGSLIDAGFIPEALGRHADPTLDSGPDLDRLTQRLADASRPVSFICLELSCNAVGGIPIRMQTLRAVRDLADRHGVPLVLDATRFAENVATLDAEPDLWRATREILSPADAATFSLSKDFGLTAGGLLALRDPAWAAAAKQHILTAGRDLTLSGRKQAAFALHDTEAVEALIRERMAATAALWEELSRAGLPVPERTSGHCVLLDTTRLAPVAGYGEPLMATLAWIFAETGIRGGPHLGDTSELKQAIRFAVPLGVDRDRAAAAGRRIAALLTSGTVPPDLVAAGDSGSPAAMVYRPAKEVPADVTEALRTGQTVADDNEAVLREACPTLDRRLLPLRGGEVEVFTAGTGPALLMLAPFNIGAGLFARQFAALSDSFQVIAVHHAGVGATSGIDDITFDGQADLAREVLATLGVDQPAHIAGASFGGLSALAFALRHPDATASLTLIGSSYKIGNRVGEINRLATVARDDFDAVETACGPERFGGERARLEQTLLRCESMDPRTGLRYLDVFAARPDLLAELPRISVPTLVIQGRHDTVVPLKAAYALYGAIPDARFVELDDAGHFPCLTNAVEINALFSELT